MGGPSYDTFKTDEQLQLEGCISKNYLRYNPENVSYQKIQTKKKKEDFLNISH